MQKDECEVADAVHSRQMESYVRFGGVEAVDEAGIEFERYRSDRGSLSEEVKFWYKISP